MLRNKQTSVQRILIEYHILRMNFTELRFILSFYYLNQEDKYLYIILLKDA